MFRKLILAAVVATGTVAGLTAAPATAAAQPPLPYGPQGPGGPHHPHHVHYVVLVRHHHGHWERYETFYHYDAARHAVWHLERQGRIAQIEVVNRGW